MILLILAFQFLLKIMIFITTTTIIIIFFCIILKKNIKPASKQILKPASKQILKPVSKQISNQLLTQIIKNVELTCKRINDDQISLRNDISYLLNKAKNNNIEKRKRKYKLIKKAFKKKYNNDSDNDNDNDSDDKYDLYDENDENDKNKKILSRGSGRNGEKNQIHFDQYVRDPVIDKHFVSNKYKNQWYEEEEEYIEDKNDEELSELGLCGYKSDDGFIVSEDN